MKNPGRIQQIVQWTKNNKLIAAAIILSVAVAGIASFGENVYKIKRIFEEVSAEIGAPSEATLSGNFIFSDDKGLHYVFENKGRKPAFIVAALTMTRVSLAYHPIYCI